MKKHGQWNDGSVECVVMCGGKSTRFLSSGEHKSMAPVGGLPLIERVVTYWSAFTDRFVFVVKHGKEELVGHVSTLPIEPRFVEPADLKGIADGLSYVAPLISDRFIVVLGDCFCQGEFTMPKSFGFGIGVQRTSDKSQIQRNYSVRVRQDRIVRVEEKPQRVDTDLCGLGFYFLQPEFFRAIRETAPSGRTGHVEITDVVQTVIDSGTPVAPLLLKGDYVNVTVPDDLRLVEQLLDR